jgi:hypothetical protein
MHILPVYKSEHAQIHADLAHSLIRLTWSGNAAGLAYRAPVLHLIGAVEEFHLKYFLSDARNMGPILYDDLLWSQKEIVPKLIAAGLKRIANLSSRDGLNVIAVDNLVNAIPAEAPFNVAFFDDEALAMDWLLHRTEDMDVPVERTHNA